MTQGPLPFLNRIARKPPTAERCELCSAALGPIHQHLLDPKHTPDRVLVRWVRSSLLRPGWGALPPRAAPHSFAPGLPDG